MLDSLQNGSHANAPSVRAGRGVRARQKGVSLLIALIVLVIMTLAGIELMRSVDTTNIIAGNLGFQQAATHSGDAAIETAIAWLQTQSSTQLQSDICGSGYHASYTPVQEPPVSTSANTQTWSQWWNTVAGQGCITAFTATDPAGNQWAYTINRMCSYPGASQDGPVLVGGVTQYQYCSAPPFAVASSTAINDQAPGSPPLNAPPQVYYRITANITGPRGTSSYIQAIVAM
jgi:type IV pilus assembly protein PilX